MTPDSRRIRDIILAALATPIAPSDRTKLLRAVPTDQVVELVMSRVRALHSVGNRLQFDQSPRVRSENKFDLNLVRPYHATVHFEIIRELPSSPESRLMLRSEDDDCVSVHVLLLALDESAPSLQSEVAQFVRRVMLDDRSRVVVEPSWLAGWFDVDALPLAAPQEQYSRTVPGAAGNEGESAPAGVTIRRVRRDMSGIEGRVVPHTTSYAERIRLLEADLGHDGPVYLCSTFLPPVTFDPTVVERFYRDQCGYGPEMLAVVRDKVQLEWEAWHRHVRAHMRIDIIDRDVLLEYMDAPEYYQMPLEPRELAEQLRRLLRLLETPTYELCLTPEPIDLAFEIRGEVVWIRTDRRNKGRAREGRIAGIKLSGPEITTSFSSEFWSIYNRTPTELRDRLEVSSWLRGQAERRGLVLAGEPS